MRINKTDNPNKHPKNEDTKTICYHPRLLSLGRSEKYFIQKRKLIHIWKKTNITLLD